MIDLGRKPSKMDAPTEASDDKPYYPSLMLSTEEEIAFPKKGKFTTEVSLMFKRSEESEDEKGHKRYSYTLDVCGIAPGKASKEKSEPKEEEDAAGAIMKAMGRARSKKMDMDYGEEE